MASLIPERSRKGIAFYKCPVCLSHWKRKNSTGHTENECPRKGCGQSGIRPYKFKPYSYRVRQVIHGDYRRFGEFECGCGNFWKSAYAWVTMPGDIRAKQQCRECDAWIKPISVRPLLGSGGSSSFQSPHDRERCEKCIDCGGDCRDYRPPPESSTEEVEEVVEEDIPDDESVLSVISPAPSISGDDDDKGDLTPVASDTEEDVDQLLSQPLKTLSLK